MVSSPVLIGISIGLGILLLCTIAYCIRLGTEYGRPPTYSVSRRILKWVYVFGYVIMLCVLPLVPAFLNSEGMLPVWGVVVGYALIIPFFIWIIYVGVKKMGKRKYNFWKSVARGLNCPEGLNKQAFFWAPSVNQRDSSGEDVDYSLYFDGEIDGVHINICKDSRGSHMGRSNSKTHYAHFRGHFSRSIPLRVNHVFWPEQEVDKEGFVKCDPGIFGIKDDRRIKYLGKHFTWWVEEMKQ
ncbi:MAG: hypothetical protein ABEJ65_08965, partial [bacterium]